MATHAVAISSASARPWCPVLSRELVVPAQGAVEDILVALEVTHDDGSAGFAADRALLFGYLAATDPRERWYESAGTHLNEAIARVCAGDHSHIGLFGGLAGVGWTIEHVADLLAFDDEQAGPKDDPIADIDELLIRRLRQDPWSDIYDLIGGLVGLGVYFLERMPRATAREGLGLIVRHLDALAQESWGGLTWHTPSHHLWLDQREAYPDGYDNLGVAHGVPGILHFLSQAVRLDIESAVAARLLEGGVKWLVGRQRPPNAVSRYSCWFVPGREPDDSRLAWCYGDLGIAAVWLDVGRTLGRQEWVTAALRLLDRALEWPGDKDRIVDTPLCHGACGVAHICNRVYHATGDDRYREAANKWYMRALQMRSPGAGIAGFPAWRLDKTPNYYPDPSFLAGAIGVVLALTAATSSVEPNWDRMLLISSR